jgi:predicted Zn-dependent peptidase
MSPRAAQGNAAGAAVRYASGMRLPVLVLIAGLAAGHAIADTRPAASTLPHIDVETVKLANGMRFLIFERHDAPIIATGWVAHVGSVNEREGITGISHLFEHMMFKGTHTLGTTNLAEDLRLLQEQETVRDQMRDEMRAMRQAVREGRAASPEEAKTPRYRELEARFAELVQAERKVIVKDELDRIYSANGGEQLNAMTTEDYTAYFVQIPSNRLELWAWLESDRLQQPVFREFYSERDVVMEERRRSVDSSPLGPHEEAFNALFWEAMPYRWPVIGWPSDVTSISKAEADAYFGRFYAPDNLTGVIVGDVRVADVKPLLERYFGRLKPSGAPPADLITAEPQQQAEKRYRADADTPPTLRVWWHAVPFVHRDRAALDLLSDVFSGRTGRFYKSLVLERKMANSAGASIDLKKYGGAFQVEMQLKDGQDPAAAEQVVYDEIARVQKEGVPADELQKLKNQAKANAFRRLNSPFSVMIQLMIYDALGDWEYINRSPAEYDAVTSDDLKRVASQYLTATDRTVGVFLRKGQGGTK